MRYLQIFFMLIYPTVVFAGNNYHVVVDGGRAEFQGEIVAESCRVNVNNDRQYVDMGTVSTRQFGDVGEYINPTKFSVQLADCNSFISSHVTAAFSGDSDSSFLTSASVGHGPHMADGVAISLFDVNNNLIELNDYFRPAITIKDGNMDMTFFAKYVVTKNRVVGGRVNSLVDFKLIYQ